MDAALRELAQQILAVPGAPDKLLDDYFPGVRVCAPEDPALESWQLPSGRQLALNRAQDGALCLVLSEAGIPLASLPLPDNLAAQPAAPVLSPIVLALVAMAMGIVEGDKSLAAQESRLLKSAKELMLIAACRLCG